MQAHPAAAEPPMMTTSLPPPHRVWLTPWTCRLIFAAVVVWNLLAGWRFLTHHCPIDLSGDEAQYWTWSRHLDLSYYSKGPLIAYLIRASCMLIGQTMPAIRAPALLLAAGTSVCTYWLTHKLFGSDRLALGAFLLGGVVPLYLAGGTLMTIDSPFFFCWALATCLAAKAILDQKRWAWIAAGFVAGLGFLAKYAMLIWLPLLLLFLSSDRSSRFWLRTAWPWLMVAIALAMTTPVLVWNAQHHWVSLRHVATQTGANDTGGLDRGNLIDFLLSQLGLINPAVAVMLVGASTYALGSAGRADPHRRQMRLLLAIGLPFLLICAVDALRTKVQPNWPAPAYFTLLILVAYFLATRRADPSLWRRWRGWLIGAIGFGIFALLIIQGQPLLYAGAAWVDARFPRSPDAAGHPRLWLTPPRFDPMFKLRGIADPFASTVSSLLKTLPPGAFILCEDYQDASQLSFYVDGQPATYFVGSYWTDPVKRRRLTQYDMWPDRRLDRPELIGCDAVYIGTIYYEPLRQSFHRVEPLPDIVIRRDGLVVRSFTVSRCYGFKGIHRPSDSVSF
jgi:4-amino-4-deoxy-L-arabinose transferase-like glycosyltransferase